jgi:hypothetical protein
MSPDQAIDDILARLARAELERDAWRAAGCEARYLQAFVMVEGLAMQLQARFRQKQQACGPGGASPAGRPPAPRQPTPAQGAVIPRP